jgi:hypothetical protein
MCHSCRNPGCFVPAAVFLLGTRELGDTFRTAALAAVTLLPRLRWSQPLDGRGRGELLHSAKMLPAFLLGFRKIGNIKFGKEEAKTEDFDLHVVFKQGYPRASRPT